MRPLPLRTLYHRRKSRVDLRRERSGRRTRPTTWNLVESQPSVVPSVTLCPPEPKELLSAAATATDRFASGEGFAMGAYDADGNPGTLASSAGTMGFAYDERGRVTSISGPGASSFRYDGDGRRVERVAGGVATRFVYDGDGAVVEADGANRPTLYRLPGVGFVRNGAQRYEQGNALGSVLAVRDASGAVVGRTEYDAYGRETYAVGGERGGQRFAGQKGYQNDDATGMQLLGARYYLPKLGRFLTPDPIGHAGGPNLYAYCEDSPLMAVDPDGTEVRNLNQIEWRRLGVANQFLIANNHQVVGGFYNVLMRFAPDRIKVDTELGGAIWRYNTLYLGPGLFEQFDTSKEANRNGLFHLNEYQSKAWFASILYHEFYHVLDGETFRLIPGTVGAIERHAWDGQINFLRGLQKHLPLGTKRDRGRRGRIGDLIDNARQESKDYRRGF